MKKQVFYIHGGESYTNYEDFLYDLNNEDIGDPLKEASQRWKNRLRVDLPEYEVFTPSMPNKQNAKYTEWKIWFERHFFHLHDNLILIGGSLGGMFLAKYLIENEPPFHIKALFMVGAPWPENIRTNDSREDGGDFASDTTKVEELARKASKIYIFHSKDDSIVPYEHALKYKEALPEAELMSFEDKNHFLIPEFPELIEKVKSL
ncbi:MAG: alpha/beta hydrolase [Patescibacteria group bacterium]